MHAHHSLNTRARFPAACAFVLLSAPVALTAALVPRLTDFLRDFGVVVPKVGIWLINAGDFLSSTLGLLIAAAVLLVGFLPLCILCSLRKSLALPLFGLASLIAAAYFIALGLGLVLPVISAQRALAG